MHSRISVSEQDFQIAVVSTHTFDGDNTETTLPCILDSQLISGIHFSFSGTVDRSTSISPNDMSRSSAVQTFRRYLTIACSPFAHDFFFPADYPSEECRASRYH